MLNYRRLLWLPCAFVLAAPLPARAQRTALDSIISTTLANHPLVRAAAAGVRAAQARVHPAGALPDPMVMLGIENLPVTASEDAGHAPAVDPDLPDEMTMRMIGVSQSVPFPGKLAARKRSEEQRVALYQARLARVRRQIVRDVSQPYFELAYVERALPVVRAAHSVSREVEQAAQARYAAGAGDQRAVLDARVATARYAERLVVLEEERHIQLAALSAAIGDSVAMEISAATIPELSLPALPPLAQLQQLALTNHPDLRTRNAEVAVLANEIDVARKERLPDFDLSVRYGQRDGRPDMISAAVGIPIPWQKGRKQDDLVRASAAEVEMARAELSDETNRVRAEVARLRAELERTRAQLDLFSRSIVPQAQAAIASARAGLQTGRVELFTVLQRQTDLLEYQLESERMLADYAQKIAQLAYLVGKEVLP